MVNVCRFHPVRIVLLLGFLTGYAVGTTVFTDDSEEFYQEDPLLSQATTTTTTPEPTYPDGVNTIPGDAEIHYPIYEKIFKTSFSCSGRLAGFYADIEARCQIWHICDVDGRMQSFLCNNGTIFSQQTRVCEWWYNTNCEANYVKRNYEHNKDLYQTFKETKLIPEEIKGKENGKPVLVLAPGLSQTKAILRLAPISPSFSPQITPTVRAGPVEQAAPPPSFRDFSQQDENGDPKKVQDSYIFISGVQIPRQPQHSNSGNRPDQPLKTEKRRPQQIEEPRRSQQIAEPRRPQQIAEPRRPQPIAEPRRPQPITEPRRPQQVAEPRRPQQIEEPKRPQQIEEPRRPQQIDERRHAEQHLTREELEQRRQAARDEFYSIPAQIEQENRISHQRRQEEQRTKPSPIPQFTIPSPKRDEFPAFVETRRPETAIPTVPTTNTKQEADLTPIHKFRHSTPRKHNVHFRPTPQFQSDADDEKQISEETQRNGFPFYNRGFYSRKRLRKIDEDSDEGLKELVEPFPTEYVNPYLPTSNAPIEVRPTASDIQPPPETFSTTTTTASPSPKRRTRKRRLRPVKKQLPEGVPDIPLPVLSYRPPPVENPTLPTINSPKRFPVRSEEVSRIESLESSKLSKRPKNPSGARVVVKRKFRDHVGNGKQVQVEGKFPVDPVGSNRNAFPGNPHLEQMVENEFNQAHATQKRCAVVGTGNTFKVLC